MEAKLDGLEIEKIRSAIAAYAQEYINGPVRYVVIKEIKESPYDYDYDVPCEIFFNTHSVEEVAGVRRTPDGDFELPLD